MVFFQCVCSEPKEIQLVDSDCNNNKATIDHNCLATRCHSNPLEFIQTHAMSTGNKVETCFNGSWSNLEFRFELTSARAAAYIRAPIRAAPEYRYKSCIKHARRPTLNKPTIRYDRSLLAIAIAIAVALADSHVDFRFLA